MHLPGSKDPVRDWVGRHEETVCPPNADSLPMANECVAKSDVRENRSLSVQTQYDPNVLETALLLRIWVPVAPGNRKKLKHKILHPAIHIQHFLVQRRPAISGLLQCTLRRFIYLYGLCCLPAGGSGWMGCLRSSWSQCSCRGRSDQQAGWRLDRSVVVAE